MQEKEKPKQHKTLSDKLKKKREELKKHKKEKKLKKEAYDPELAKEKFFNRGEAKSKDTQGVKVYKLKKALRRFTEVFEDDVEDFYSIWGSLDEGAEIELEDIENQQIKKVLKSICKHLHLRKTAKGFAKPQDCKTRLGAYVKSKMEEVIENYIENGTGSEELDSNDEDQVKEAKEEKQKKKKHKKHDESQPKSTPRMEVESVETPDNKPAVGPTLPPQLAKHGQSILTNALGSRSKPNQLRQQPDQIDMIFNAISSKPIASTLPHIPNDLYAPGSAKLHEEQPNAMSTVQYMNNYNKQHRPKSLMEIHKQLMKESEGKKPQRKAGERVPFTREQMFTSDRVDLGQLRESMEDGVFFNFEDKMSKPTINNSFL